MIFFSPKACFPASCGLSGFLTSAHCQCCLCVDGHPPGDSQVLWKCIGDSGNAAHFSEWVLSQCPSTRGALFLKMTGSRGLNSSLRLFHKKHPETTSVSDFISSLKVFVFLNEYTKVLVLPRGEEFYGVAKASLLLFQKERILFCL